MLIQDEYIAQRRQRRRAAEEAFYQAELESNVLKLLDVISFFRGKGGTGKSAAMIATARNLMDLADLPVIGVGANLEIKPAFFKPLPNGSGRPLSPEAYHHFTEEEFVEQIGLVNEVFAGEELESKSIELAAEIAANAPLSLKGNKRIINSLVSFARLSEQQEQELLELRLSSFSSEDFREGVHAFGEKRRPDWQGR